MRQGKRTKGKRARALIVFFILGMAVLTARHARAEEKLPTSGKWEKHVTWKYDKKTRKLTITAKYAPIISPGDVGNWGVWENKMKVLEIRGEPDEIDCGLYWSANELTAIILPDSVKRIGGETFGPASKVRKVRFPDRLERIGEYAFTCLDIRKLDLPDSVTHIGRGAFSLNQHLRKVQLPNRVKKLSREVFNDCIRLREIKLPESLEVIGKYALDGTALREVTIPRNVVRIEREAFARDEKKGTLKKVVIQSKKIREWGEDIFGKANEDLVIQVPKSCYKKYKKALRDGGLPEYVKVAGKKSLG